MYRAALLIAVIVLLGVHTFSQSKSVKALPDGAAMPEVQKWLIDAVQRYASYKTRTTSVAISDAKFEACELGYKMARKSGGTSQDSVGVTTRTHTTKTDVVLELTQLDADSITITDHLYPEFQNVVIHYRKDLPAKREIELVVKYEAAAAMKSALQQAIRLCGSKG